VISFVTRLNCLVQAFIGAMSSVMWVGVLLVLMVYIFAIMAQNFFKDTMPKQFGTVPSSMCALFQILTLDSWASMIVWEINTVPAWLFFIFFVVLGSFGLLNLLTGVFIESLLEMTRAQNEEEMAKKEQQRNHLISLISSAFQETDVDGGGTLDPSELPILLDLCKEYREALDFVGLSYSKMERACEVADYDHDERTYWERIDPATGEKEIQVHHTIHRPRPSDTVLAERGFNPCEERPDGVLEGELVDCLTEMDEPLTKADYFAIMRRLRRVEEDNRGLLQGIQQVLCACGGDANWMPGQGFRNFRQETSTEQNAVRASMGAHGQGPVQADVGVAKESSPLSKSVGKPAALPPQTFNAPVPTITLIPEQNEKVEEVRRISKEMFERYDLDCSGSINSVTELRQFTTNMLFTIRADVAVAEQLQKEIDTIEDAMDWSWETTFSWLHGHLQEYGYYQVKTTMPMV